MRLVTYNPSKDLFLNEFVWFQVNRNSELGTVVSTCSRDFNDLFKCRSKECKEDIQAVNSRQDFEEGGLEEIRNLLVMQQVQRAIAISERMKEQFAEIKKFQKEDKLSRENGQSWTLRLLRRPRWSSLLLCRRGMRATLPSLRLRERYLPSRSNWTKPWDS
ncbi:hypothetical protein Acr_12g0003910 [Actinidia rufa]|uniref:Uncharacterized protein n=1 Tax=Actinidia rufa TaxID=165716 RepID=A0A7J0FGP0_9ERIC|nr:hypothetical protein Acr_12g0003910 [Actinidia rufa]